MIELEKVYSDISPWKQGDILMYIGGSEKLVVVGGGWYEYGVWQMMRVHSLDTHCTDKLQKQVADWNCVKVGEWDFENGREIEDGQT